MLVPYNNNRQMARFRSMGRVMAPGALGGMVTGGAKYLYRKVARQAASYAASRAASSAPAAAKRIVKSLRRRRNVNKAVRKELKKARPLQKLKREVKQLKQMAESDTGTHIHRTIGQGQFTSSVGQSSFNTLTGVTMSVLELALANLKYYNPSAPSTLVTADASTGSYAKEFLFKNISSSMTIYNNYQIPVHYTIYAFAPKEDTSITPATAYTNGLTDVGGISSTSILAYPTDSDQLTDLWKIIKSSKGVLMPGESAVISHTVDSFQYDPSVFDSHSLDYQSKYGCHTFGARIHGPFGHDTSASERGFLQAAVDVSLKVKYTIKYSAGADIKQYTISDGTASTFTNGGVVSEQPVADNISYSVS